MTPSAAISPEFLAFVTTGRAEIDAALERWLPAPPSCPPRLAEATRYAVMTGGKRFRPLLALAAAEAVAAATGAPGDETRARAMAMPLACAIECVHAQSLVHDDLPAMDDDVLRRGQPTVHVRYGVGMAILVGDGLLAQAFALMARASDLAGTAVPAERTLKALSLLGDVVGASGMVGGQALDLAATGSGPGDLASLIDMHARKTGGLIRAAAVGGAIMAGGDEAQCAAVDRFARDLGLAFQIVDDVLDVEGCAASLGKSAGKDARDGKATVAALVGCDEARRLADTAARDAEQTLVTAGLATATLVGMARAVLSRRS